MISLVNFLFFAYDENEPVRCFGQFADCHRCLGYIGYTNYQSKEVEKMNIANLGFPGLILILVIALIIFGPNKLPEIGRAAGNSLREFKNATKGLIDDNKEEKKEQNEN